MPDLNDIINLAAAKAPPFYTDCPDVWFVHVENLFRSHNITKQETMFTKVMEALDKETLKLLPPSQRKFTGTEKKPYDTIKDSLMSMFQRS